VSIRIVRVVRAVSRRATSCARCLQPIRTNELHHLLAGEPVGDCCLQPEERAAAIPAAPTQRRTA
jgi:hypothetical protein